MKVFVAGATGAVGRPLVQQLLDAGHEVVGMTRSPEKAEALERAGAGAAVCDAYDRDAVIAAVQEAAPDALMHQLTDLPRDYTRGDMSANDRIRRDATPHLLEAASRAGVRRLVAQSTAFIYAPSDEGPADEDAPVANGPPPFDETVRVLIAVERAVVGAGGLVLRYGHFYGPGTYYAADGFVAGEVRRRRYPVVGGGRGVYSFVHTHDAAAAAVAALERGAPGVYNVVDDDPAPLHEWLPAYAEALGAPAPLRAPRIAARLAAGRVAVEFSTRLRGASNAKAKRELGWEPSHPSWRQGFVAELAARPVEAASAQ